MDLQSENGYSCKFCGFGASSKEELRSHLSTKHKEFKCSICQEKFTNLEDIRFHIKEEHLMKWTCQICDKSFPNEALYKSHCNFHLNITSEEIGPEIIAEESDDKKIFEENEGKPPTAPTSKSQEAHKCIFCDFVAVDSNNLDAHISSHVTIEILQCNVCDLFFDEKIQLEKHKVAHKKIYYQCGVCNRKAKSKKSIISHVDDYHLKPHRRGRYIDCNSYIDESVS